MTDSLCSCGVERVQFGPEGYFRCLNCDVPQGRELEGKKREKTVHDHRFDLALTRKMREWYPGDTGP